MTGAILDLAAERRGLHFCSRMGHIRRATSWAGNAIACAAVSLILVMARPSMWRAGGALGATHNGYGGGTWYMVHAGIRSEKVVVRESSNFKFQIPNLKFEI